MDAPTIGKSNELVLDQELFDILDWDLVSADACGQEGAVVNSVPFPDASFNANSDTVTWPDLRCLRFEQRFGAETYFSNYYVS